MSSSIETQGTRSVAARPNWLVRGIVLVLLLGIVVGFAYWRSIPGGNVLTDNLSEPLDGATAAKVDLDSGPGHLTIDGLTGGEQLLASGTLQYLESQAVPSRALTRTGGQATLTLRKADVSQSWLRLPWAGCGGAYEWQVRLNPGVPSDLTAHSDGGSLRLNLAGLAVTGLAADTGGGNLEIVLPDKAAGLSVQASTGGGDVTVDVGSGATGRNSLSARSGAGNVLVRVPAGLPARIQATTGAGKATVDPRFARLADNTYQSPDYDSAANRVEIAIHSGAGNVSVSTK